MVERMTCHKAQYVAITRQCLSAADLNAIAAESILRADRGLQNTKFSGNIVRAK
jgi:hypothetical protein